MMEYINYVLYLASSDNGKSLTNDVIMTSLVWWKKSYPKKLNVYKEIQSIIEKKKLINISHFMILLCRVA